LERLLELLDRTVVHFVHCFLPDTKSSLIDPSQQGGTAEGSGSNNFSFDIPYMRKQLKSSYLLENMRLYRIGEIFYFFFSLWLVRLFTNIVTLVILYYLYGDLLDHFNWL